MKLAIRLLLMAGGLAFFAWFVIRVGFAEIGDAFRALGWMSALALLPYALVYLLDTLGWRWAFGALAPLPFSSLFRVRWAGEAVNSLIPSAYIGGEATKVFLLHQRGVPASVATVSVVAGKTCQSLAQVILIALGALAAWASLPAGSVPARAMFAVSGLTFALLIAAFWVQRRGLFGTLFALARRLRISPCAGFARESSLRGFDQQLLEFYTRERRRFAQSTGTFFAAWLCDPLEIWFISHLLGLPLDYPQALAIEAFISVAKSAAIFVPGALGVQESSIVFLGELFGLPPALGVSYALFRRARELLYAAVGCALLAAEGATLRKLSAHVELRAK